MKQPERRFNSAAPVELRVDGDSKKIVGTAAVYYDGTERTEYLLWDTKRERVVERIMPGAFGKALERKDDTRGLFNHNPNQILGRTTAGTMQLSTTGIGLGYEIDPGDTSVARDVMEHLRRGDVTGSSFAFIADEERWTDTKDADGKWHSVREILSVTLFDVGPVTYPAYEATSSGVREARDMDEAKASLEMHRAKQRAEADAIRAEQDRIAIDVDVRRLESSL